MVAARRLYTSILVASLRRLKGSGFGLRTLHDFAASGVGAEGLWGLTAVAFKPKRRLKNRERERERERQRETERERERKRERKKERKKDRKLERKTERKT